MIRFAHLINERFELSDAARKQLETTAYSAMGHILNPFFRKQKVDLLSSVGILNGIYSEIKKFADSVKTTASSQETSVKLVVPLTMVDEFNVFSAKKKSKRLKITIERDGNDIFIDSDEKLNNKLFDRMVLSKDYMGWDFKDLTEFLERIDHDYKNSQSTFEEVIVELEQILSQTETWKSIDRPKKPKFIPNEETQVVMVYDKSLFLDKAVEYQHYFRVVKDSIETPTKTANYYHHGGGENDKVFILQTIYLDNFRVTSSDFLSKFQHAVGMVVEIARHEGRHLIQYAETDRRNIPSSIYGGPKKKLSHQNNPDVRGTDSYGYASPSADKNADPNDKFGRVKHPFRDVEFKTNLYHYKLELENALNQNFSKQQWKSGFKSLISYAILGYRYRDKFATTIKRGISTWPYTTTAQFLKMLFTEDRPKFDQTVKELYKLIFNP
jgi:hypothetical protein